VIDISNPRAAIRKIADVLDSDIDARAGAAVAEAKRKVMWDYNLLASIDRLTEAAERRGQPSGEPLVLRPEQAFRPPSGPTAWYIHAHARLHAASRRWRRKKPSD